MGSLDRIRLFKKSNLIKPFIILEEIRPYKAVAATCPRKPSTWMSLPETLHPQPRKLRGGG